MDMDTLEVLEDFEKALFRRARVRARNTETAEEIVQEVALRAHRSAILLARFSEAQKRAWLLTTLDNACVDTLRKEMRDPGRRALREGQSDELVEADAVNPEETVFVGQVLKRVPQPDRDILSLSIFYGLTSGEIGARLGMPAGTVRSRLHDTLTRLRRKGPFA